MFIVYPFKVYFGFKRQIYNFMSDLILDECVIYVRFNGTGKAIMNI